MLFSRRSFLSGVASLPLGALACKGGGAANEILNVSYDPTRELYEELNGVFTSREKAAGGIAIKQSHGGSGKQARSVIDGLKADVVSLALAYDIDALVGAKLVKEDWQKRLPNDSCPFTSTIVFLVRKGNPKNIVGWDDLARDDVAVITPNPKTSGGARWNYLAAWGFELGRSKDEGKAKDLVTRIFKNVPVLDAGARGSTTTFVERKIGDVLVAWENEALLATNKLAKGELDIVVPQVSILAEPPIAVVDKIVDERGTRALTERYVKFLYEDEAQEIGAKHFYRPTKPEILAKSAAFSKVELFSVRDRFKSWSDAQAKHFSDGGSFDQVYQPR